MIQIKNLRNMEKESQPKYIVLVLLNNHSILLYKIWYCIIIIYGYDLIFLFPLIDLMKIVSLLEAQIFWRLMMGSTKKNRYRPNIYILQAENMTNIFWVIKNNSKNTGGNSNVILIKCFNILGKIYYTKPTM